MPKTPSQQDKTLYCENCGISFIWTAEEQKPPAATVSVSPSYCPGCRYLLPVTGRERGLVKWYHRRKGYGFLTRYGESDLYVNRSALQSSQLKPEMLVDFTVGVNRRGVIATDVKVLEAAPKTV